MNQDSFNIHMTDGQLLLEYAPSCDRTMYDICDIHGRVIKTGAITSQETRVDVTDMFSARYVILIVDGDRMVKKQFTLAA